MTTLIDASSGTISWPVVRLARAFSLKPSVTEVAVALQIAEELCALWVDEEAHYVDFVGSRRDVRSESVSTAGDESPRVVFEGNTPVAVFPRVVGRLASGLPFDSRICAAICFEPEFSSKALVRFALPFEFDLVRPRSPAEVFEHVSALRAASMTSLQWLESILKDYFIGAAPKRRTRFSGRFEVSGLGTDAQGLGSVLEKLDDPMASVSDIVAEPEDKQLLLASLAPLVDEPTGPELPDLSSDLWMASPSSIVRHDGTVVTRDSLYVVREAEDRVQALGVSFDDTSDGSLVRASTLRVARWIAGKV